MVAAVPWPAGAQFGLPGMPRVGRVPLPVPGASPHMFRVLPGMHFGKFRRAFGIIGAVAVGSVILGRLSRREGAEVTRRTRVVLDRDPNQEVVDTYRTADGSKEVTITAGPAQRMTDFKDDPALRQTAEVVQQGNEPAAKGRSRSEIKAESDVVKLDQLPEDAQCRKVTTEMEIKSARKKAEPTADSKAANVSILCHVGDDWKPASI
jgi:hypothetical protein